MQDRELLELAAKAYGLRGVYEEKIWTYEGQTIRNTGIIATNEDGDALDAEARAWNPLSDDGDCARMEAGLLLRVTFNDGWVSVGHWSFGDEAHCEFFCDHKDRNEARRRASTYAAAEIGKNC